MDLLTGILVRANPVATARCAIHYSLKAAQHRTRLWEAFGLEPGLDSHTLISFQELRC